MFGQNPKRPPHFTNGETLLIQSIFPTIQGEGFFSGVSAFFIRLGGCNLACEFCDTEFENFSTISLDEIFNKIREFQVKYPNIRLIVITGGEPMRQNIIPLCEKLLKQNFTVQLETNGTINLEVPENVYVMCSPKSVNGKYFPPHPNLIPKITAFKFLISTTCNGYNSVPEWVFKLDKKIYIQPMDEYSDEKNKLNQNLCIEIAMKYNLTISLQTHKILKID